MSSPERIPIAQLLQPISADQPSGIDVRYEQIRKDIVDAGRAQDRDMLAEGQGAAWNQVVKLSLEVLSKQSKDLEVAARLAVALTALHGFSGLRDGLRVMLGIMEHFWDSFYPLIDEGDLEPRVGPIALLADEARGLRLPGILRTVPLLTDKGEFSWAYWNSRFVPPKGDQEPDEVFAARKSQADEHQRLFDEAASATSLERIQHVYDDLAEAQVILAQFDQVIGERFGTLAPGTSALKKALEENHVLVRRILREKGGDVGANDDPAESEGTSTDTPVAASQRTSADGPIRDREDAFRRLMEVAAYFRRAEPQSPVPCLIDRAVAWGKMPFNLLLQEMIKDSQARNQVSELLGLPLSGSNDGET